MVPFAEQNIEPSANKPNENDASPANADYDFEEGLLEEFNYPEYEQNESVAADDSDEHACFEFTEPLNI